MDTIEIVKENTDSLEITKNAKNEFAWKVKVYGNDKEQMYQKALELKEKAEELCK